MKKDVMITKENWKEIQTVSGACYGLCKDQ